MLGRPPEPTTRKDRERTGSSIVGMVQKWRRSDTTRRNSSFLSYVHVKTPPPVLVFLDIGFVVFHSTLILFNLTGWIWKKTRKLHLVAISLTCASWLGLGIFYGFGYCPSTDWHWEVKRRLGQTDLPLSYVKYYLDGATGWDWNPTLVDASVAALGFGALLLSIAINLRDARRMRPD